MVVIAIRIVDTPMMRKSTSTVKATSKRKVSVLPLLTWRREYGCYVEIVTAYSYNAAQKLSGATQWDFARAYTLEPRGKVPEGVGDTAGVWEAENFGRGSLTWKRIV
jgi:hypothetical protein